MKITIGSADGLGDFVLRVPLISALVEAGHEVQLFLREPALGLVQSSFPQAECVEIAANPYSPVIRRKRNPFLREHREIRRFDPDLYLASAFAIGFFDEVWSEQARRPGRIAGFTTNDGGWPSSTVESPEVVARRWDLAVSVEIGLPELEKNRRMGEAILERSLPATPPALAPDPRSREAAGDWLRGQGLERGCFWVVCVGARPGLQTKDWGEENWARFFEEIDDGTPLLFLGNTKESDSIDRIRSPLRQETWNLARDPVPIPIVLGLVAEARGYVGRDSGVMHLTGATGRPVFALYGGGHWGRFLPSGPGVALSVDVPCRGCDFACPQERVHCVRDVSQDFALAAWQEFLSAPSGLLVREQSCPPDVLERINSRSAAEILAARSRARRDEQRARGAWWRRLPGLGNLA